MENHNDPRALLSHLFHAGLHAVNGCIAVERQLRLTPITGKVAVLAIGKAATSMMQGAQNSLKQQIQSALIITKEGYGDPVTKWPCIESGHPLPNQKSLEAGDKLLDFMSNIPTDTSLLALISGGASSLVEVLAAECDLAFLQQMNTWLLASGYTIHEINKVRQAVSGIKGGKALAYLSCAEMQQFLISDVENDDISIIGSGLFVAQEAALSLPGLPDWLRSKLRSTTVLSDTVVRSVVIASNETACQAVVSEAKNAGLEVSYYGQALFGDVFEKAKELAAILKQAKPGLYIWGGETTLALPGSPGRGGRNQSLALALALEIESIPGLSILVAATDGSDGPTDDAGAIIDGFSVKRGEQYAGQAAECLRAANAGYFLQEAGDLISTGPTGTNVMDLVIAFKEPQTD